MTIRRILLGGIAAVALVAGGLWATGSFDPAAIANEARNVLGAGKAVKDKAQVPRQMLPSVSVVKAERRDFIERMRVTGTLVPRKEILVAPEIEGQQVAAFLVDAGDRVKAGQVLARLARENLDAQLAQSRAQIARADASIAQAQSAITQAEARLVEADAALTRAKPLAKSRYLSESLLDQRQAAATSARAALAIARNSLSAAESDKAAIEARQRELDWRLQRTEIKSPVDGLVLKRNARVGAIASAQGEAMFKIAAGGEIELLGDVPSDDLVRLRAGQTATLLVGGVGEVEGTVRLIEPEVDQRTRLGKVRIVVGAHPQLHVGQFASALIETRRGEGIAVPLGAVMHDSGGAYLQALTADGRIETRRIKTALVADGFVQVREGLGRGELVVAKAGTFLADGDRVNAVLVAPQPRSGTRARTQAKAG